MTEMYYPNDVVSTAGRTTDDSPPLFWRVAPDGLLLAQGTWSPKHGGVEHIADGEFETVSESGRRRYRVDTFGRPYRVEPGS